MQPVYFSPFEHMGAGPGAEDSGMTVEAGPGDAAASLPEIEVRATLLDVASPDVPVTGLNAALRRLPKLDTIAAPPRDAVAG